MRGVGWAICYENPANGRLSNHWITLHETGNVAGFNPVLVMDVWEHAFLLDYKPAERPKYIEAFFSNIDWNVCDERLKRDLAARSATAHELVEETLACCRHMRIKVRHGSKQLTNRCQRSDWWKGLAAGLVGGLVASWTMNRFQDVWSKLAKAIEAWPDYEFQNVWGSSPKVVERVV